MSGEEKLQALVAQMKMIEAYLGDIAEREVTIAKLIEDGKLAVDAIRNISGSENVQILMPLGIGVYAPASVAPAEKLVVNVGADVALEKTRDDAINYIESRVGELEAALRSIFSQKQDLQVKMEQSRAEVNALLQGMRQQPPKPS